MEALAQTQPLTITTKEIMNVTGFSRTTLWRKERDDGFPKATIGKGLYSRKAVNQWLEKNGLL
ncbi:AlpA family phage regulatory protein [Vibrio harveyi]